jgi:serine/threonine-protein kinase
MEVTAASDVYSLGVVAYECLAGTRPFDGASQVAIALAHINRPPPPLPADVPPAVRLLVERALAKDAADRFPDGGAFADAVRRVAAGGSLAAVAPHGNPPTTPSPVVAGLADSRTQVFATPMTGAATGAAALAGAGALATGPARTMPPLQAPDDDDWPDDDDLPPERRGRNRWIWVAAALVVLLLLGGGAWFLLNPVKGSTGNDAGGSTSAESSAGPTGLFLDPKAFIGHPVTDVSRTLTAAGLKPDVRTATRDMLEQLGQRLAPGDVAGLDPSGVAAKAGDTVVLYVARNGFTPEGPASSSAAPRTSAPRTTAASSASQTTAQSSATESSSAAVTTSISPSTSLPASSAEPPTSSAASSSANGAAAPGGSGG